jgi:hypothetical protein
MNKTGRYVSDMKMAIYANVGVLYYNLIILNLLSVYSTKFLQGHCDMEENTLTSMGKQLTSITLALQQTTLP